MSKLRLRWGKLPGEKKKRLVTDGPSKPDARLLLDIFTAAQLRELESRGYDLRTLKFEITRQAEGVEYTPVPADCI